MSGPGGVVKVLWDTDTVLPNDRITIFSEEHQRLLKTWCGTCVFLYLKICRKMKCSSITGHAGICKLHVCVYLYFCPWENLPFSLCVCVCLRLNATSGFQPRNFTVQMRFPACLVNGSKESAKQSFFSFDSVWIFYNIRC
jgi:hypothetical protein